MERKVVPRARTYDNIAAMKKQFKSIGLPLDWGREFATCDPSCYKQQQKLFLDFLAAVLAEREQRKPRPGRSPHLRRAALGDASGQTGGETPVKYPIARRVAPHILVVEHIGLLPVKPPNMLWTIGPIRCGRPCANLDKLFTSRLSGTRHGYHRG
jgi:hypothetical protein